MVGAHGGVGGVVGCFDGDYIQCTIIIMLRFTNMIMQEGEASIEDVDAR